MQNELPNLLKLAKVYLSPPGFSTLREIGFEVATAIQSNLTAKLLPINIDALRLLKFKYRAICYQTIFEYPVIASEAEAPKAPSLHKGAPSTVTWKKEQRSRSCNIDFLKNCIRRKNPSILT